MRQKYAIIAIIISALLLTGCNEPNEPAVSKTIEAESAENAQQEIIENAGQEPEAVASTEKEQDKVKQPDSELVFVEGGTFTNTQSNYFGESVTISDFYIGKYEVTQKEWAEVMGNNPSEFQGYNLPVESVNWYDCIEYCNKRSIKEGLEPFYDIDKNNKDSNNKSEKDEIKWTVTTNPGANGYRLPTEAEWEYAAGGGQISKSYSYSGSNDIDEVAWYWKNSGDEDLSGFWSRITVENNNNTTKPVGLKKPNELGLYDMSGNVREWCWDWYEDSQSESGFSRVWRGGGWLGGAHACLSSYRGKYRTNGIGPDTGLRVCRGNEPTVISAKDLQPSSRNITSEPRPVVRSSDELHIAWPQPTQNGKMVVVIDGQTEQEEYDDIGPIIFSSDGNRVAYPAQRGSKWVMVVDGQEGPEYDDISLSYTVFSPDNERIVYGAKKDGQLFVVLDGKVKPEPEYDSVDYFTFSPDSKRLVYGAKKDDKWFVVLDDKVEPESGYNNVGYFTFSPDSSRFAYSAQKDNSQFMVVDGDIQTTHEQVGKPVFSPDGKRFAYLASITDTQRAKERQFVMLDSKEGKKYERVNRPVFSKDSKHIAYTATEGLNLTMVVDGEEGPEYDGIGNSSIVFSSDGEHFAYAAKKGDKWFVVMDGEEGPEYDGIAVGSLAFSPAGKDLAYGAKKDERWFLVLNDLPIEYNCNDIGPVLFSPDGKHIIHKVLMGNRWGVMIDGKVESDYKNIYKLNPRDEVVEYMAERDGWLFRCRQGYPSTDAEKLVEEKVCRSQS